MTRAASACVLVQIAPAGQAAAADHHAARGAVAAAASRPRAIGISGGRVVGDHLTQRCRSKASSQMSQKGRTSPSIAIAANGGFGASSPIRCVVSHRLQSADSGHRLPTGVRLFATQTGYDRSAYSITSSARARINGGIVRPSALAVLRLMMSLNVVGCSIGRSAG